VSQSPTARRVYLQLMGNHGDIVGDYGDRILAACRAGSGCHHHCIRQTQVEPLRKSLSSEAMQLQLGRSPIKASPRGKVFDISAGGAVRCLSMTSTMGYEKTFRSRAAVLGRLGRESFFVNFARYYGSPLRVALATRCQGWNVER